MEARVGVSIILINSEQKIGFEPKPSEIIYNYIKNDDGTLFVITLEDIISSSLDDVE